MTKSNNPIHPDLMQKIVSLAKRRGFIFPGSEIYGGLAGTYDYGPLGEMMRQNVMASWREKFIKSVGRCARAAPLCS